MFKYVELSSKKASRLASRELARVLSLLLVGGLILMGGLIVGHSSAAHAVALSPQDVVDLALKQAPAVKQAELLAQAAEGQAEKSLGAYDLLWKLNPSYTYTEAQNLSGFANPVDKTWAIDTSLAKAFSTGTSLSLEFNRVSQESELSSFTSNLRRPTAASDVLSLSIRQALWRNILGEGDRASIARASAGIEIAQMNRQETLESAILESLSLYWNAYVAETQLRENSSAREKYEELVKAVRRKAGFNLSSPGELPRLEAEFEAADARVKISSKDFLAALDKLRTNLQIGKDEPITFKASATDVKDIPDVPKLKTVDMDSLRPMVIAQLTRKNAEREKTVAKQSARPKLDLLARAASTGVDSASDGAFTKMTSGTSPTYVLGFELEVPLDSAAFRGTKAEASAKYRIAEIDYQLAKDRLRDSLADAERTAQALRENALASIEIVSKRSRVVREFESSYRQGRTPLVELIRAFNELFEAQLNRARSVGNYMIALNQWAAIRDELVKGEKQ